MNPLASADLQRPTVLVVDDEPAILQCLIRGLKMYGFSVMSASSGGEAIELFRANPEGIHLALIDHHMPGLDGLATMRALRHLEPSLRCCIMSGTASLDSEELLAACADRVLAKPFSLPRLAECLHQLREAPAVSGRGA